jgi:hypothetical protein
MAQVRLNHHIIRDRNEPRVEEPQEIRNGQRARCYRASEGFDQGI